MIGKIGSAAQSAKNFVGKVLGGGGSSKRAVVAEKLKNTQEVQVTQKIHSLLERTDRNL